MQARPSAGEKARRKHRAERHLDQRLLELIETVVQTVHESRLDAADSDNIGAQRGDMAFTVVVELHERGIALGMGVDLVLHQTADLHQRVILALVDGVFEEDPVEMRGKEDDTGRQRQCEQQHRPAVCTFSPAPHPIPSSGEPMRQTQLYAATPKAKKHLKMPIENVHLRDTEAAARQRASNRNRAAFS
jgi:hypothetical protein